MKKQELLVWLADHLDNWPRRLSFAPEISGWEWLRHDLDDALVLIERCKVASNTLITKAEWRTECMRSVVPCDPKEKPKNELMIDIETFDTESSAIMFQAAVVFFDKNHSVIYREIWNLKFDDQLAAGRTVSGGTIAFHLGLPANAKAALGDKEAVTMREFAKQLVSNYEIFKPKLSWAKGDFDFKIIASIFAYLGMPVPWKYYQLRELRTLMSECGVKKGTVAHTALEDCVDQLAKLAECRGVIEAGKAVATSTTASIPSKKHQELTDAFSRAVKVDPR